MDPFPEFGTELPDDIKAELKEAMSKPLVKSSDMKPDDQSDALDLIVSAIEKNPGSYEAAARSVKEMMDKKFGAHWHCIIGEGFGFEITHQTENMLFVFYANVAVLLYKGGHKPPPPTQFESLLSNMGTAALAKALKLPQ